MRRGRNGFDLPSQRLGDVEIIEPGLQPDSQRARFLELLQHRNQLCRGLPERAQIVNVAALELTAEFSQKSLHALLVHPQLIQRALVEVVLNPFLDRLDDLIRLDGRFLGHPAGGERDHGQNSEDAFHTAQFNKSAPAAPPQRGYPIHPMRESETHRRFEAPGHPPVSICRG